MKTLLPAEIELQHGDHAVTLRASLRAVARMAEITGDFASLVHKVAQMHLTTIRAIVQAAAIDRTEARLFLAHISGLPLKPFIAKAQAACLELLASAFPSVQDKDDQLDQPVSTSSKPHSSTEQVNELFKMASSVLHWPASEIWNASPIEISAALQAHIDHLKAMNRAEPGDDPMTTHGAGTPGVYSADRMAEVDELGHDPAFDQQGLRELKAMFS